MKPLLLVAGVVAVGLLLVVLDSWRLGADLVGVAFCLAAALRLVLPAAHAGDLVVRSRVVDAAVLLVLGFGTVALAQTVPG